MARPKKTTEDKLKIINASPALWLKNFVKITDSEGNIIPFVVNDEQQDFINNMGRYNIIEKSRQIGFSTLSLGLMLWSAFQIPNSNYMMLAQDEDAVNGLFTRLKLMYESIPDKYRIPFRKNNEMELFLENGSRITVKVASKMKASGMGRSFSLTILHLSEFAFYPDKVQDEGLLALENTLVKSENARIIIESTANGMNAFYEMCKQAVNGNSKYKFFFYNWMGSGASKQFKYEYDLAMKWYSTGIVRRLTDDELDEEERKLRDMGVTLKQLTWRKWKLQDISVEKFNQEYPATWLDAFIVTNKGVFDGNIIRQRYNYLLRSLSTTELKKELPESLIPYLNKNLFIYQNVKPDERYYGGIDTAAGLSKYSDLSAISILDSAGEQTAVFYLAGIPVYKFVKVCFDLGMYFNYCSYMIERNSYGLDLITRLRKDMSYLNVIKTKRFDKITGKRVLEYGWNEDNVSKAKLINDFKEAFEEGIICINDRETLQQMEIYQETNGKMGNIRGKGNFDDLVIATGLSIQALKSGRSYI